MKLYHLILSTVPGAIAGAILAWQFVFNALVPWLGVPQSWSNIVGLILYLGFFAEVGAILGALCLLLALVSLALLLSKGQDTKRSLGKLRDSILRYARRLLR